MPLLACRGFGGAEELSLRSDELSSWGRVPVVGEGCFWNRDLLGGVGVEEEVSWLAPHCGGGTEVTVPGLGAVGSGGRGVPGSGSGLALGRRLP